MAGIGEFFVEMSEMLTSLVGIALFAIIILFVIRFTRSGAARHDEQDTRAEIDDLHDLADRMERRIGNLETILTGRMHENNYTGRRQAADGSE